MPETSDPKGAPGDRGNDYPASASTESRRGALLGLVITLVLVLGGLYLVHVLRGMSQIQDCVMSGRTNCAPIDTTPAAR